MHKAEKGLAFRIDQELPPGDERDKHNLPTEK